MIARLVECSDYDVIYGILTVNNVELDDVQYTIYNIKREFYNEGIDDWTIEDVFAKFPTEWEWDFVQSDDLLVI